MIMQRTALDIIRKRSFAMLLLAVAVGRYRNKLRAVQSFSIQGRLTRRFGFDVQLSFESNQPVRLISDLRRSIPSAFSSTRLLYTPTAWPENLYSEWTAEQDRLLWSYVKSNEKSAAELAVILGRGTRGVEKRIAKLKDVNSAAYRRLFVESTKQGADRENSDKSRSSQTSKKLVPSHEVLRRIEWDYQLDETDFLVLHYDRVDNMIISSPLTAPNESINSGETSLIKALPEHRIMAIQYKDRVVWDRRNNRKVDRFFGAPGILSIIETYDNWKETRDKKKIQQSMLRQAWNARWIDIFGGSEQSHDILLQCTEKLLMPDQKESTNIQHNNFYETDPLIHTSTMTLTQDQQCQVDAYLETVQTLFHPLCRDPVNVNDEDTSSSVETDTPGLEKHEAILVSLFNELSEWIASPCWSSLESDDQTDYDDECNRQVEDISHQPGEEAFMREMILRKVASIMDQLEGKQSSAPLKSKKEKAREANRKNQQLKSLLTEEDLEETFVRGSGAGGQKINKTSNRVVLVHLPTNLRVECQETRSLSQNRKIARKRMIEKLDLHLNGNQSKQQTQQRKQTSKKRKTKAKNKARLAAKQEMKRLRKLQEKEASEENDDEYPF